MTLVEKYRQLMEELAKVREKHGFKFCSLEEDDITDKMDDIWWDMSDAEQREIDPDYPAGI